MLFDRPSWIAFATSLPLPQQAGIPCIFIALAAAAGELKLASNSRYESAELRARAADETAEERERADNERNRAAEERERAAFRARSQAQYNLVKLRHQLDPSERNARRVRDVISLLEEYGGMAEPPDPSAATGLLWPA